MENKIKELTAELERLNNEKEELKEIYKNSIDEIRKLTESNNRLKDEFQNLIKSINNSNTR